MGWLVGAVGVEHDPRTTKSRGLMALQPPAKSNCWFCWLISKPTTLGVLLLETRREC